MDEILILNKYRLILIERNEKVLIAQIFHFLENEYGGILKTLVGNLVCFREESHQIWRIKFYYRNDIKYSHNHNRIFVFTKSSYKNKVLYYIDKVKDFIMPNIHVDKELDHEIVKILLDNKCISEPYSVSRLLEVEKEFKFIGNVDFY